VNILLYVCLLIAVNNANVYDFTLSVLVLPMTDQLKYNLIVVPFLNRESHFGCSTKLL